jgi:putative esterase
VLSLTLALIIHIAPAGPASKVPLTGRMMVFAQPAHGSKPKSLDPGFVAAGFTMEGFDVNAPAGASVEVPDGADAYPAALSVLAPGTYDVQALLDVKRMYSYDGYEDGDLTGPVQRVHVSPNGTITLQLNKIVEHAPLESTADVKLFDMVSPLLTKFYGHPTHLRASVLLPIGYDSKRRYPVVYFQNGFGGTYAGGFRFARLRSMMAADGLDAIVVFTDSSGPTGITQFADSANNGPWGQAFTTEFIPALEARFNTDRNPNHRLLWGHSSGGWASLWLQITYPKMFGGTWSSSPDPVDFHDFTGPDLLAAPPDNAYTDRYGRPWQLVRLGTQNVMTLKQFVLSSVVEGYQESQFGSFDAVFSPRGADGKPMPLFDRRTGVVDPAVAAYWEAHYDIATNIERNYEQLAPFLQHKLHVAVGTLDTFHLERGVLRLDARLRRLGMVPDITYFPNASHFSLFRPQTNFEGFHWAFRGMAAALKAR